MMNQAFSLKNKVAVVTGGIGLLGKEHCRALADAGADVVVVDIREGDAASFANEVAERYKVRAIGVAADITKPESVRAMREKVVKDLGRVDIIVNNAAQNDKVEDPMQYASQDGSFPSADINFQKFEHYPLELWQRSMDVNVTGTYLMCQILGAELAKQGAGSIINVASTYGIVAPDQSLYKQPDGSQTFFKSAAYPTTKGAVISFTRFLAAYWGHRNVRVNTLSPGGVEAGQDAGFTARYSAKTPLERMAKPTDYWGAIVFLASDASAYMTGANLVVDGGFTSW